MQTIAEWYNQQKSRREAERQKQNKLMSTYFQQKAKLGENKLANDKTVSFVQERLKSSLGKDYGEFEEQLSQKLNLPKLKEQYPYSYGEKYSLLAEDMLNKYQKGEKIETETETMFGTLSTITGKDFTPTLEGKSLEEKQVSVGEQENLINEFKSYNDALEKSGIKVDYSDVTSLEEAYNKAKDKYMGIKQEGAIEKATGGVSKPIESGGVVYGSEKELLEDVRTGDYTKEQIKLKIRDMETSGTEVENDTEDELMTYASDYNWTGEFTEKLRVSGIPYLKNLDSEELTKAKKLEEMEGIGDYISGLSNAIKSAPEQKKKQLINRHKSMFMQGEEGNFYYIAPEAQGEIEQYEELQAEKNKLEEEQESLDVPKRSGLFGWKGYKDLTTEQQKALDRSKEIDQEINKIEDEISESRKKLEENRGQIPEQFNQGFLTLENEILNQEQEKTKYKTTDMIPAQIGDKPRKYYTIGDIIQQAIKHYNIPREEAIKRVEETFDIEVVK